MLAALALAGLLGAGPLPAADDDAELTVIRLEHRLFEELRPLLEPLLEPGATLTGSGDRLIVRTSPANLAELRAALAAFDTRAQRLRVSVSHERIDGDAWDHYGVDAAAGGCPSGGSDLAIEARIARTRGRDEGTRLQSVLTVDGASAWIADVDARPQSYVDGRWTSYGPVVEQGLGWQEAQSGFYVTPRLRGDEVQIEISSQQQRYAPDDSGRLTSSGVDTVVTGRLGEWLPLGASLETSAGSRGEILAHTRRRANTHTGLWLRVDPVP